MTRFEITDQSGRVTLKAWGRTLEELFTHMALGMFGARADVTAVQPMASIPILAQGDDFDALLAAWLRELIAAAARDQLVFMNCRVTQVAMAPSELCVATGEVVGEVLDSERHAIAREFSTVREPVVRRDGELWMAEAVLEAT